MVQSLMTLGGQTLRVNPEEVRWNFTVKARDRKSMVGKVVQILGVTLSDITIQGHYAPDRKYGDTDSWDQMLRFREWVKETSRALDDDAKQTPIRFTYPPRGWDFPVYLKGFAPMNFTVDDYAPAWNIVLFPVDNGARKVIESVRDLYIERLMNGIGWKQTAYNGPTQAEVDTTLGGRSVEQYLADRNQEVLEGSLDGTASNGQSVAPPNAVDGPS